MGLHSLNLPVPVDLVAPVQRLFQSLLGIDAIPCAPSIAAAKRFQPSSIFSPNPGPGLAWYRTGPRIILRSAPFPPMSA